MFCRLCIFCLYCCVGAGPCILFALPDSAFQLLISCAFSVTFFILTYLSIRVNVFVISGARFHDCLMKYSCFLFCILSSQGFEVSNLIFSTWAIAFLLCSRLVAICLMSVAFTAIIYNRHSVLFDERSPPSVENGITHAALIATSAGLSTVLEFSAGHGVQVNASEHAYQRDGWFMHVQDSMPGVVYNEGLFNPLTVPSIGSLVAKAMDGTWTKDTYRHDNSHNCYGFVNAMVAWGVADPLHDAAIDETGHSDNENGGEEETRRKVQRIAASAGISIRNSFSSRFFDTTSQDDADGAHHGCQSVSSSSSSSSLISRFNIANLIPVPSSPAPTTTASKILDDSVGDLLNATLVDMPRMHHKAGLVGLLFKNSGLSAAKIHEKVPSVSVSTIKRGLRLSASDAKPIELEKKEAGVHRVHLLTWERDLFVNNMRRFFIQPLSGSKATKKGKTLWRTEFGPVVLWTKYTQVLPNMVKEAFLLEKEKKYTRISATPRSYHFFQTHMLPLVHFTYETNARRCHYCEDLDAARTALVKLETTRRASLSDDQYDAEKQALEARIAKGEHHEQRWYRQSSYIKELRANPAPGQVLIQTDYFSFYTVTSKKNVLALVLSYLGPDGIVTKEHVQYYSAHKHDYVFTVTGFNHAFQKTSDILANAHGPKFTEVVITGDTAMFKGPFLCALGVIAETNNFTRVRCVPFCTKHGSNECDGAGSRVKSMVDAMLIDKTFDEKHPASFCAHVMESSANVRAYPMYSLIGLMKPWVDSLMPGGNVDNIKPPRRGFGEIFLTGLIDPFCLLCRTDVDVPEPWRLEKGMGYPLPVGEVAPSWVLVDLLSNPTTLCMPCTALRCRRVFKQGHVDCVFQNWTKHNRCGQCGQRSGHNRKNCPTLNIVTPRAFLMDQCFQLGLSQIGSNKALRERIDAFVRENDDVMPDIDLADNRIVNVIEVESDSDLSEENDGDFIEPDVS